MADEKDLTVIENNDSLVQVHVQTRASDGTLTDYNLTGATVEFYFKADRTKADNDADTVKYDTAGAITITDAAGGELEIRFAAGDTDTPGDYYYHLDTIINSNRETVMYGRLKVVNV